MGGSPVATLGLRLVGLSGMRLAIGRTQSRLTATEVEFVLRRIADRPTAHPVVDRQDGCEMSVFKNDGILLDNWRLRSGSSRDRLMGYRAARTFGARRSRTACKAKAMDLADDRIARDTAQDPGDLASGKPLVPKGFQLFDAFIRPTHRSPHLSLPQDIVPDGRSCTTDAV